MPGPMVSVLLPARITAGWTCKAALDGAGSAASGSATNAAPVCGWGLKLALPVAWAPPTT